MVPFHSAKRYPAKNAIFAPQVLSDFLAHKGNPTSAEYRLPNTVNALGYTVIRGYSAIGGVTVSAYSDVDYYGSALIASGRDNLTVAAYYDYDICLNYQTNYFRKFISASSSGGKAYKLYRGNYSGVPRLMLSLIGNWNDVRDMYDDYAIVLTNVIKYENSNSHRLSKLSKDY